MTRAFRFDQEDARVTTTSREPNEQKLLWNGLAGRAWVDTQALMDSMLEPFQHLLLDETPEGARAVLDVGCGTGSTTLALSERKGHGTTIGVDISEPMLDAARRRALARGANVSFVLADAQTYAFEAGSFDAVVSRFGVMFFDDPVRAFANLRSATPTGGRATIRSWRSAGRLGGKYSQWSWGSRG
jgi:ubiquinone/menaquinone biosynthesis C-methylase UbiE